MECVSGFAKIIRGIARGVNIAHFARKCVHPGILYDTMETGYGRTHPGKGDFSVMIVMQTNQLTKAFGVNEVLKGVTLTIQDHHRVGLVGSNGSGKSTLLKILAGQDHCDGGTLSATRGLRIGFHTQLDDLTSPLTVWQEMETCFEETFKMEEQLREMEQRMGEMHDVDPEGYARLAEEYAKLTDRFEEEDGYAWRSRLQGVLTGLGFTAAQYDQTVASLSGGERTRLKLGKLLLTRTDLILLDEPTNHLDLNSIQWLEDYLRAYKGAVVVVSHDRYFLDAVCNSIAELSFGRIEQYEGNYTRYLKLREEVMVRRMKEYTLQQKEIAREEAIIAQFRAYNTEAAHIKAKSREKRLNMIERVDKPVEEHNVYFSFHAGRGTGNDVLMCEGLSKRFGPRTLFQGLNLHVRAGDRIALLGESGAGKSTLLKVLAAMCGAEGEYTINGRPCHAYRYADFRRQVTLLAQKTFVFSASIRDNLTMFSGTAQQDEALVKTLAAAGLSEWYADRGASMDAAIGGEAHALSGGEERRLDLARTLWRQGSLVMLDEPTAGLDEKTRVELEKQIVQLPCDILIVAMHNYSPKFLDSFTKVLRIRDGELEP